MAHIKRRAVVGALFSAALTQTGKSCSNSNYNTQAQVDTHPQRQQNMNKTANAINAIGGLFK